MNKLNYEVGFTLMEMLASVAVLMVLTVTAVSMFSRSLKSSTYVESQRLVDSSAKTVIDAMSRYLREAKITTLNTSDKVTCLTTGSIVGGSPAVLVMEGLDGYPSTFTLSGGGIASNSSRLTPESVTVTNFAINWICGYGQPDRLDVSFTARVGGTNYEGVDTGSADRNYSFGVTLRNSNI
jgi:type II secretory pathway pseudopilin PulG